MYATNNELGILIMSRYMVTYTQKYTGKLCESDVFDNYSQALADALYIKNLNVAKTIVILCDSEGSDHPENAGKFFLERIVK